MSRRFITISVLVLSVVLLLAVNMVANEVFRSSRWDLTANHLFTLSKGTLNILNSLDEPITLRLYMSKRLITRLPSLKGFATRVEELLEEYKRQAKGKLHLRVIDPDPFSVEEDRAVGYGIRGVPVGGGQENLYFGLVGTGSTTQEQVIASFSPSREKFLEYDLSRLIYSLAHEKKPVVGLLSSLAINGGGPRAVLQGLNQPAWMVMEQAKQLFEVLPLDQKIKSIPKNVDVLMVVHPKDMAANLVYAIDQFVLRGGRLLMFIDPNAEADQSRGQSLMGMSTSGLKTSNPKKLLRAWGVRMSGDKVVGDISAAARVRAQQGAQTVTLDYPPWMNLGKKSLNADDIITGDLDNISIASSGYLEALPGATTTVTPLLQSSEQAKLYSVADVQNYAEPEKLLRNYQPAHKRFILAARIKGKVKTAFPDGPPKSKSKPATGKPAGAAAGQAEAKPLTESVGPVNLIVVADVDMLEDRFWVQTQDLLGQRIAIPIAANGPFVINALENLSGSNDLIAIRSRGGFQRPFQYINTLRQSAELKFRNKEQELKTRLDKTEKRLQALESEKQTDDARVLSDAQQKELIDFRQQRLGIRKALREVRHGLRRNIEDLEALLKFLNIALVPILIGLGGLVVGFVAMARTRRLPHN